MTILVIFFLIFIPLRKILKKVPSPLKKFVHAQNQSDMAAVIFLGQSAVIWAALLLALLALGVLICSFAHLLIGGIWPICARSLIQAG